MNIQQPPKQFDLMQYLDNRFNSVRWSLNALGEYLERHFPGAKDEIERLEFYHRCWSFMMGREAARAKAPAESVLVISTANAKVIDALRKEAQEKGWLNEFHKAEINVQHEAKELYGRK